MKKNKWAIVAIAVLFLMIFFNSVNPHKKTVINSDTTVVKIPVVKNYILKDTSKNIASKKLSPKARKIVTKIIEEKGDSLSAIEYLATPFPIQSMSPDGTITKNEVIDPVEKSVEDSIQLKYDREIQRITNTIEDTYGWNNFITDTLIFLIGILAGLLIYIFG